MEEISRNDMENLSKQNLPLSIVAGFAAALVGAVVWAAITYFTERQIGWMAIGVGALVGFAVRMGKGMNVSFKVVGAAFALFGCLLGNLFAVYAFAAKELETTVLGAIANVDLEIVTNIMKESFSPMDLLFYGLAIYAGWQFSMLPQAAPSPEVPTGE